LKTVLAEIGGPEAAGSAMGVGLTFTYAAGFVAPPVFGLLVDTRGFSFAWRLLALMLILAALVALAVRARGTRPTGSADPAR
jgi:MFS family permease